MVRLAGQQNGHATPAAVSVSNVRAFRPEALVHRDGRGVADLVFVVVNQKLITGPEAVRHLQDAWVFQQEFKLNRMIVVGRDRVGGSGFVKLEPIPHVKIYLFGLGRLAETPDQQQHRQSQFEYFHDALLFFHCAYFASLKSNIGMALIPGNLHFYAFAFDIIFVDDSLHSLNEFFF